MSTGSPSPFRSNRFFSPTFRMMLFIWAIVVVGAYLLYQFAGPGTTVPTPTLGPTAPLWQPQANVPAPLPGKPVPPATTLSEAPPPSAPVTPVVAPRPKPEEVAATKMRWVAIKTKIDDIQEKLDPALEDTLAWTKLLKQLPSDEGGKRIAGSKPHIDKYRRLMQETRPPARLAEQYRDTLKVHQDTITRYLAEPDNTTGPSAEMTKDLDRLREEVKTLADKYHEARLALEGLVTETATMPAAETTLEKAVQQREREAASQYLDQLTATRNAAEAEAQRVLRAAEEKAIKEKTQAEVESRARLAAQEVQRIHDETEQRLAAEKEAAAKKRRDDEAQRLRNLAEDPEIQRQFACFLEKGYLQFTTPPKGMMSKSERPTSVSFGDLNGHGWLKDVESFAAAMSRSPSPNYRAVNDRPTRGQPKSEAEWAELARLLEQFKSLGPIWVEMKLLEP